MVSWLTLFFPRLPWTFFFAQKRKQIKHLKADNIRDINSSLTLKGRSFTQFLLGKLCMQKLWQTVRHGFAVTLDTCCHKREGIRLISTCPEAHSIDAALHTEIIQVIISLFKVGLHLTHALIYRKEVLTYLCTYQSFFFFFFYSDTLNQPVFYIFYFDPILLEGRQFV